MKKIQEEIRTLLTQIPPTQKRKRIDEIRKHSEWVSEINSQTTFLDFDKVSLTTRVYYYLNDLTSIVNCKCCGQPIRRNCDLEGSTLVYCSRKCSAVDGVSKCKATKLERYGSEGYMNPEKVLETWSRKTKEELAEVKKKYQETCLAKYGVASPTAAEVVMNKIKATNLQRYGTEIAAKSPEVIQKIKQTVRDRYGVDNVMQAPEVVKKFQAILDNRTEEDQADINSKRKETCLVRYGVEYASQSESTRKNISASHHARTNDEIEKSNQKRIETCKEKYGVDYINQAKEVREKTKETCISKYGTPFVRNDKFRRVVYYYDDIMFDSSYELYYYIWAKETGKQISRAAESFTFTVQGKNYYYFPDFCVDGKLIEIKGEHFFNERGELCNPYTQDEYIQTIYKLKGECAKANNVQIITDISEQVEYVDGKYTKDFVPLFRDGLSFPYLNSNFALKSDKGLIQHFHKSIYHAHKSGFISPYEAWNDKRLVLESALNRLKYVGRCRPSDVLQGFNVAKIAPKVSVFDPNLAKTLILKYIHEDIIVDPFSGFSGRLLGAIRNHKTYHGYDINEQHVQESRSIVEYLHATNVTVDIQDILEIAPQKYENTALFTCPPYNDKESWNEDKDRNMSCDEWITECLNRFDCSTYLFVVDKTIKFKEFVVETIENQSHFNKNTEYVILIQDKRGGWND